MKKVVFIIAQENFRDEELIEPAQIFQTKNIHCVIASEHRGRATGKFGTEVEASLAIRDVLVRDFDAVIFVGGKGSRIYVESLDAWKLAQGFADAGKVVGAIGTAPTILANAAILLNRKATADHEEKDTLIMRGADYTSLHVQRDGNIVTAKGPADAKEFARVFLDVLRLQMV